MPNKLKSQPLLLTLVALHAISFTECAPKTWPYMKSYDIWDTNPAKDSSQEVSRADNSLKIVDSHLKSREASSSRRKSKVINFFSLPIDDECLSDDGRRVGMCMNVYECQIQGGTSRGSCALGFGACCVFETTCDQEVHNNITYFVSPKFPGLMPSDKEHCSIKIKLMSDDISQIRLDFLHFTLSQPNRMTGVCESDVFSIEGGIVPFVLCGHNSGQHIFYDIGSPKARAEGQELKINVNLGKRSVSTRLWEVRISQIPFSSKAPSGCLQHFTGIEGIIQTFNFADNGRHLANQDYRSCVRQEKGRCGIQYEPCDEQSFRIGPMNGPISMGGMNGGVPGGGQGGGLPGSAGTGVPGGGGTGTGALADPATLTNPTLADEIPAQPPEPSADDLFDQMYNDWFGGPEDDLVQMDPASDTPTASADPPPAADDPAPAESNPAADDSLADETQEAPEEVAADEPAEEEGSGGGGFFSGLPSFGSLPSFPSFGFPSFPSFFRTFSSRQGRSFYSDHPNLYSDRQSRQLYSPCTDRITLPCIVEDFIGAGMGDIPSCIPVHCGSSLCQAGLASCKVETSVTPFHIGVHFGDGKVNKGSPEDNIGACLRYKQLPCS